MAKFISGELARLIRDRAYAQGAAVLAQQAAEDTKRRIGNVLRNIAPLYEELRVHKAAAKTAKARLQRLDKKIKALAPNILPGDIRAIRRIKKRPWKERGDFRHSIAGQLKAANGDITTDQLVRATAAELGLPIESRSDYIHHRDRIRRLLQKWRVKGYVIRVDPLYNHAPGTLASSVVGIWRWVGATELLKSHQTSETSGPSAYGTSGNTPPTPVKARQRRGSRSTSSRSRRSSSSEYPRGKPSPKRSRPYSAE